MEYVNEAVLEIQGLSKKFGSVQAVDNLSFQVNKGDIYAVLGPNGSGKSTLLGMLLHVVIPNSGSWKWFGKPSNVHSLKQIGAIIERPSFYPYMTAIQNLKLVCTIKNISTKHIEDQLKQVNLYERRHDKFKTYSLGMKQRLAIASSLLNNPEILILDEPTNGLDPEGIREIRMIIQKVATRGTTIILASHLLDEVEKVCSHVLVIRKGKKLFSGPVDQLTHSNGFFILKSKDHSLLENAVKHFPGISHVQKSNSSILAYLNQDVEADELNQFLFERGVVVSHLEKRKETLEEQFMQLTGNQ